MSSTICPLEKPGDISELDIIITITSAANASPPPHNAKPLSSAATRLALPSSASDQPQLSACFRRRHRRLCPPPSSAVARRRLPLSTAATVLPVACCQPSSTKSICLPSKTLSSVVLRFVLQMARDRPAHLIQARGEQRICAGNAGSGHSSVDEWRRHECRMD